jgi:hypothetical protein
MQITASQMAALARAAGLRFENEMVAHAAVFAPDRMAGWGDERLRQVVRQALQLGNAHGFDLRGPLRMMVELFMVYGGSFEADPRLTPLATLLRSAEDQMHRAEAMYAWVAADQARVARGARP